MLCLRSGGSGNGDASVWTTPCGTCRYCAESRLLTTQAQLWRLDECHILGNVPRNRPSQAPKGSTGQRHRRYNDSRRSRPVDERCIVLCRFSSTCEPGIFFDKRMHLQYASWIFKGDGYDEFWNPCHLTTAALFSREFGRYVHAV